MIFFSTTNNFFFENLVHQFQKIIKNYVTHWCQPRRISQNITSSHKLVVNNSHSYKNQRFFGIFTLSISENDQNQIINTVWNRKQNHIPIYHPFLYLLYKDLLRFWSLSDIDQVNLPKKRWFFVRTWIRHH